MALASKAPIVSVVTVVKNDLQGLRVTLASVLMQSDKDFEWLIIDGFSDDGTSQLCQEISNKKLGKVISTPPNGIYDAMNQGLANATGEYVLFINAGDFFVSANSINTILRVVNTHQKSVAFPVIQINSKGAAVDIAVPKLMSKGSGQMLDGNHQGFVVKKSAAAISGNFDVSLRYAADGKLMDNVASRDGVILDSTILTAFVIGGASSLNISKTLAEIQTYRGGAESWLRIRVIAMRTSMRNFAFEKSNIFAKAMGAFLITKVRSRVIVKLEECQELDHWHSRNDTIPNYNCCLSLRI